MPESTEEVLSKFSWKLLYAVRNWKEGGYSIYENNAKVENRPKDIPKSEQGYLLYYNGKMRSVLDLTTASGLVTVGKVNAVANLKKRLEAVNKVFVQNKEAVQKAAEKLIEDVFNQYDSKNYSFVPKNIRIENGQDPKYLSEE